MSDFFIKQNDTSPSIIATLKDSDGDPVDITGATVRFHMTAQPSVAGKAAKVDAAASIVDAANGQVQYNWQTGDTDTPGTYDQEWEVTFAGGAIETFPDDGYQTIKVVRELA